MKKYGLQLRVPPSQQKKQPGRPPLPPPIGFNDDDDDDDVEKEISRQASKYKSLKDVEEQHRKTLEEDPSAFDYDGVYDDIKQKAARPKVQEQQERKPKYIQALINKAKQREREHEVVYERKLAKERTKEDHLYADKDKFVTSAYKRKLAEQAKWLEEERLRELREAKDDVTKKTDISDFYFNLSKNVAFGGGESASKMPEKHPEEAAVPSLEKTPSSTPNSETPTAKTSHDTEASLEKAPSSSKQDSDIDNKPVSDDTATQEKAIDGSSTADEPPPSEQPKLDHHKRKEDALAAAKERFLARKKAKEQ